MTSGLTAATPSPTVASQFGAWLPLGALTIGVGVYGFNKKAWSAAATEVSAGFESDLIEGVGKQV
jgi:hypothetical protein